MQVDMNFQSNEAQPWSSGEAEEIEWWTAGASHHDLNWPHHVKAMFGMSAHTPASVINFYKGLHPADRHSTVATYIAAIDPAHRTPFDTVFRTLGTEDGRVRRIRAQGQGEFSEAGQCTRLIGRAIQTAEYGPEQEETRERMKGGAVGKLSCILRCIEREEVEVDEQIDFLARLADRMAINSVNPERESVLTLLTAATVVEIRNAAPRFGVAPNLKALMLEAMQIARGMIAFRP